MTHIIEQIADAVVAAVKGASTNAGTDVSQRRFWPAEKDTAASGIVFASDEDVAIDGHGPYYRRDIAITVALRYVGDADTIEASAYADQVKIETAIEADATIAGLTHAIVLHRSNTETDGNGNKPMLIRRTEFIAIARTLASDPENPA
ncbi:hypothetical protein [Hoeflea sp. TYP-13]|uniref:hypothetical protein n=1 Tax=Hoeflea sp. TYP-13 TaxID=3230023 RepID=UPI0034C6A5C9